MQQRLDIVLIAGALAVACCGGAIAAGAQNSDGTVASFAGSSEQTLRLTAVQRNAIYQAATRDKSKSSPRPFPATVGADVPPMIELHPLPDDAVADSPAAKLYQYTVVRDEVVLVDPTRMRVVDIIGPQSRR